MPIEMKNAARNAVITDATKMPFDSLKNETNPGQPNAAPSGWKNSFDRMFA